MYTTDGVTTVPTMKAWGVTRSFGEGETKMYAALRNVSLELNAGQLTLHGSVGQRKSTARRSIGLLHPIRARC